ncbi:mutator type transposase, partial [Tanacetum coccineum]
MVVVEWEVRDYEDPIHEQEAYRNFDGNLFSLKIHHGGFFTEPRDVGVPDGGTKYQATGPFEDQCVVDIEEKKCSCRKWELTGMRCKHAVAVINEMDTTNVDVGVPESWVHSSYWVKTWAKQYSHTINPLNGKNLWIKHPSPYTIIPPKIHPQIGRPPKSRKKSAGEISTQKMSKNGKLSRFGKSVTCGKCGNKGHNKTTCKAKVVGSQASNVGGSQGSNVGGSQGSKVGGSQAAKRARGSQTGASSVKQSVTYAYAYEQLLSVLLFYGNLWREEDLELRKFSLDSFKKLITRSKKLDEMLHITKVTIYKLKLDPKRIWPQKRKVQKSEALRKCKKPAQETERVRKQKMQHAEGTSVDENKVQDEDESSEEKYVKV